MIDFFASSGAESPLWDPFEGGMIELDGLGLDDDLQQALNDWAEEIWDLDGQSAAWYEWLERGRILFGRLTMSLPGTALRWRQEE